jgi:hypothetical protein
MPKNKRMYDFLLETKLTLLVDWYISELAKDDLIKLATPIHTVITKAIVPHKAPG